MYYIYMIRCDDNSIYTGITKNIEQRMYEHYFKTKNCARYTRARNVLSLDALWTSNTRSEAAKLEYQIKKLTKKQKEEIISAHKKIDETIYTYKKDITLEQCLEQMKK